MTNPTEPKQQYEGAILQQLVKNAEILAVIQFKTEQNQPKIDKIDVLEQKVDVLEQKVDKIYNAIGTIKWILVTIGLAIVANIFSEPINNFIFHR